MLEFKRKLLRLIPWIRRKYYIYYNHIIFNLNDISYGKNFRVYNKIYLTILKGGQLCIGDNFILTSGDGINPLCRNLRAKIFIDKRAKVIIGNNVGLSSPCIWSKNFISIGNNVKIGGDCIIMDTDAHNLNWDIRNGSRYESIEKIPECETAISAPIIIEDDVFIGTRSILLKGVSIGARSIIAAGSVVVKSIPSDCVAGGNPCRILKFINNKKD